MVLFLSQKPIHKTISFIGEIEPPPLTPPFTGTAELSLYKIMFHTKALLWEYSILLLPAPYLQRLPYFNTVARPLRNIRPVTEPSLFMAHTTQHK